MSQTTYNSSYRNLLAIFIQICESIAKKSPGNRCDRQNFEERTITHEKVGQQHTVSIAKFSNTGPPPAPTKSNLQPMKK